MREIDFEIAKAWVNEYTEYMVGMSLREIKEMTDEALENIDAML